MYIPRIADSELSDALARVGAVLIEGPKACGKTETALQKAASVLRVDTDPGVSALASVDPRLLLEGERPRLIDEWQLQPDLWNAVRREVDESRARGQFRLTGSTAPSEQANRHSGAGRFARLRMRTMSLFESGDSTGAVSLDGLLNGDSPRALESGMDARQLIERLCRGGWPEYADLPLDAAMANMRDYVRTVIDVDIRTPDHSRRDPASVRRLIRSLARGISTEITVTALSTDAGISRDTVRSYTDALERIFILEHQQAWAERLRSRAPLRKEPKRHLADPALAVAALQASPSSLLRDLDFTGQLVESQAVHDLRVYTEPRGGVISHARTADGREVDAILELPDGRWALIEVKMGARENVVDQAASSLLAFAGTVDLERRPEPALIVLTGSGPSYRRADGVCVVALSALAP